LFLLTYPDLVFLSLVHERHLFGVNVPQYSVVMFVDEAYDLAVQWPPAPTSRYVLTWLRQQYADYAGTRT
jgi:hypothetical protein